MSKPQPKEVDAAPNNFSSPTPQELTLFSRKIQQKDLEWVITTVNANPRYLITSSDSPTILQVGFHYNPLHIACRWGNSDVVSFILGKVSSSAFMLELYPDDPLQTREKRTLYLTDMYLNMPEKGASETPLHFACKFSWVEVVKILSSHPKCTFYPKNKFDETPFDVIGCRANEKNLEIESKIKSYFNDLFIVPLWRELSNSSPPNVGRPIKYKDLGPNIPSTFLKYFPDISMIFYTKIEENSIGHGRGERSLSISSVDFLDQQKVIRAFAGPTTLEKANEMYFSLKKTGVAPSSTPIHSPVGSPITSPTSPFKSPGPMLIQSPGYSAINRKFNMSPSLQSVQEMNIRVKDIEKGIERVGRRVAMELGLPWIEYWEFLGQFCDFREKETLALFEEYLQGKKRKLRVQEEAAAIEIEAESTKINDSQEIIHRMEALKINESRESSYSSAINESGEESEYHSAVEDMKGDEDDCEDLQVYISGDVPGKEDKQMLLMIKTLKPPELTKENYPAIYNWMNQISFPLF